MILFYGLLGLVFVAFFVALVLEQPAGQSGWKTLRGLFVVFLVMAASALIALVGLGSPW
jgi:hypothetical protein